MDILELCHLFEFDLNVYLGKIFFGKFTKMLLNMYNIIIKVRYQIQESLPQL